MVSLQRFSGGEELAAPSLNAVQVELRRLAGRSGAVELLAYLVLDGNLTLPAGTTAQRPTAPAVGDLRFNTTDFQIEWWNGTEWQRPDEDTSSVTFAVLNGHGDCGPGENQVAIANHSH